MLMHNFKDNIFLYITILFIQNNLMLQSEVKSLNIHLRLSFLLLIPVSRPSSIVSTKSSRNEIHPNVDDLIYA
jgi:hypothetical protein